MTADRTMSAGRICIHLLQQMVKPLKKILPVLVIFENRFAFDPSNDDVIQAAGGFYASSAMQI